MDHEMKQKNVILSEAKDLAVGTSSAGSFGEYVSG
jgi:hypothetical protein